MIFRKQALAWILNKKIVLRFLKKINNDKIIKKKKKMQKR